MLYEGVVLEALADCLDESLELNLPDLESSTVNSRGKHSITVGSDTLNNSEKSESSTNSVTNSHTNSNTSNDNRRQAFPLLRSASSTLFKPRSSIIEATNDVVANIIPPEITPAKKVNIMISNSDRYTAICQAMTNIIETFNYVVGDLLLILPKDINIMKLFKYKASKIISRQVKAPFTSMSDTMPADLIMEVYKFLDRYSKLSKKYPIAYEGLADFMIVVYKQYRESVKFSMAQELDRVHAEDEKQMLGSTVSSVLLLASNYFILTIVVYF